MVSSMTLFCMATAPPKRPRPKPSTGLLSCSSVRPFGPANDTTCAAACSKVIRGKQISDAVRNRRDCQQCTDTGHAHQRDQAAVQKDGENHNGYCQTAPGTLGEGENAAQAHHAGRADGQHLDHILLL